MKPCIFFDFDGVIVDSFDAAVKIGENLNIVGDAEEYRRLFDGSIAEHFNRNISASKLKNFFKKYSQSLSAMPIVPGIKEVIKNLSSSYRMAVVSSSYTLTIHNFLKDHGLAECFVDIQGFDKGESKSEKISQLLSSWSVSGDQGLMVTDTLGDIEEARKAGVKSIGVLWGYHDKRTLNTGEPEAVVGNPKELFEIIQKLLPTR
jgi:phosphoglycolate phosphatase